VPPEVESAIAVESDAVFRRMARYGVIASCGYFAFLPLVPFASPAALPWLAVMFLVVVWNMYSLYRFSRGTAYLGPIAAVVRAGIGVAILAHLASPFLLGPGLAAITAVGVLSGPYHGRRDALAVGSIMALAVLLPWLGELVGLFSQTIAVHDNSMTLTGSLGGGPIVTQTLLALFTVVLVGAAIVMTRGRREVEIAARRQLHLQRWQLRQLVPA